MSFLEHLDELRRRLINSVLIVGLAFCICYYFSGKVFKFLEIPVRQALGEAQRRVVPLEGLSGDETVLPLSNLKEGDKGRFVFDKATKIGEVIIAENSIEPVVVSPGVSVESVVVKDKNENLGLYTDERFIQGRPIIPKGIKLPVDFKNWKIIPKMPMKV